MKYTIVIVGGMMSWPNRYEEMRDTVAELSGTAVADIPIAPLYPLDWAKLFRLDGWNRLLNKLTSLILERAESSGSRVLILGHSLGGVIGKLLSEHAEINGIRHDAHEIIGAVIGLGSPIDSRRVERVLKYKELLQHSIPTGTGGRYLAVYGDAVKGDLRGKLAERYAYQAYRWHTGRGEDRGDLLIPAAAMLPEGTIGLKLPGVYHEKVLSLSWYGAPAIIHQWWPHVVEFLDAAN